MNYRETLDWMYVQLPMYQRQGAVAYKIDLTNTLSLATYLGNPERQFKSIHVAGTNGKGSTSHMLASVLQEAGYKVGLYTSPHLKDFRERIRVNGETISEEYVVDFIEKHKSYFEENLLSFFEMTVGMAFQYFASSKVDIAIIEVGLGGRLDSTNIITPQVSVITNIGLDHTRFLGDTLTEIAGEKAGIIKKNVPVVIGRYQEETVEVFKDIAKSLDSKLHFAEDLNDKTYTSDLKGDYQKENIRTVLKTMDVIRDQGWNVSEETIKRGLGSVVKNTGLLGRWQILQNEPKVICDTAHNEDGLIPVMKQLSGESYKNLHIVLGVVNDKDLDTILPLFPKDARYYFVKPDIPRGLDEKKLKEKSLKFKLIGKDYSNVQEAYDAAKQNATKQDVIYIGGSTFVVAEII
ncbi:folylpolyglutamate synthase/dihydrofolate synthase family protein [Aquimarina sp. 2201CG5-10]|uniref:bifunctional folylpolyglutamate synthase/dihydrofolate synthase n=1 Tax=Aquimarina callyspongiae TaxID=3098150 RepID=UPI002AB4F1AF|nr:folylpolyglutamate synthase/dihydrofolate synthase family protein [Aquimarina sp. 2201CG5-10]MDY8138836.1 folylpolyglutamate synthase/dihydrofolate synthase family protein [Aquimarina sp. 2201CG5-10]